MIFIGGAAKSGTHYTVEFLNNLGINVRHEYPGLDGMVTWFTHGPPLNFPYPYEFNQDEAICIHQTREPIANISSLLSLDENSWRYIRRHLQFDLSPSLLTRCMRYYYTWNKLLENCTFTYPVEDIKELLEILDLFDIKYSSVEEALKTDRMGQTVNKLSIDWEDLRKEDKQYYCKIRRMAEKYGY